MTPPTPRQCAYYYTEPQRIPQVGGPPILRQIPRCRLLAGAPNELSLHMMCDRMAQAGGDSGVSTACAFNGRPSCPYYR